MNEQERELIRDYLDNRISAEGLERLNQLLEFDAAARAEFRAMATLEEGLRDLAVVNDLASSDCKVLKNDEATSRRSGRWYRVEHFGFALLSVACVVLAVMLMRHSAHEDQWGEAIARIESLSKDASFSLDQQIPVAEGTLLGKGWLRLERGHAQILFRSENTDGAIPC